mmetsp:Transcript_44619/g.78429  ORF Transcript_44619/g.78429 Transcript_44619/m.78429 type:complete len:788 (+) Transcript_44619:49-2412(+)
MYPGSVWRLPSLLTWTLLAVSFPQLTKANARIGFAGEHLASRPHRLFRKESWVRPIPARRKPADEHVLLAVTEGGTAQRVREVHMRTHRAAQGTGAPGPSKSKATPEPSPAPSSGQGPDTDKDTDKVVPKVANASSNATGDNKTVKDKGIADDDGDGGILMSASIPTLTMIFWGLVPVVVILVILFECVHRRWAAIDLNEPIEGLNSESEAVQGMRMSSWGTGIWPLTSQFFCDGESAGTAKLLLGVLLCLALFRLFLDWTRNIWQKEFWDSIEAKETGRFWASMMLFCQIAIAIVLSSTYEDYVSGILAIRWRASLTKNLQERWLLGRAFYTQHFPSGVEPPDNPDQRLSEDVDGFIQLGMAVFFGFFMVIGRLALFMPILYMLSPEKAFGVFRCPGWLLYVAILYSAAGSIATQMIGKYLIPLSYIKQRVEANYRYAGMQVRDHTESIALYGSEETEHRRLWGSFDKIQRVVWEQMKFSKHLGFFKNFYFLCNDIAPFCILAVNYFSGDISLGQLMQILGALNHVQESLNTFVDQYTRIADLRATTDRLWGFSVGVDKGAKLVEDYTMLKEVSTLPDVPALCARGVNVKLGERRLWDNAELTVQPGERVLLLGPDGCGKSIFLRAVAGIWPAAGSVSIGRGDALFVPQKPFLPAGTLREAASYPEPASDYTDEEIYSALRAVRLVSLDEVSLDEHADWQKRLSGGEQQRLALAHALLRKPGLLVLDETTSAIGEDGTAELYAVLAKLLPESTAVVSVDHDAIREVGAWHKIHYTCDPESFKWKKC